MALRLNATMSFFKWMSEFWFNWFIFLFKRSLKKDVADTFSSRTIRSSMILMNTRLFQLWLLTDGRYFNVVLILQNVTRPTWTDFLIQNDPGSKTSLEWFGSVSFHCFLYISKVVLDAVVYKYIIVQSKSKSEWDLDYLSDRLKGFTYELRQNKNKYT